jgi:hypothetical protein
MRDVIAKRHKATEKGAISSWGVAALCAPFAPLVAGVAGVCFAACGVVELTYSIIDESRFRTWITNSVALEKIFPELVAIRENMIIRELERLC